VKGGAGFIGSLVKRLAAGVGPGQVNCAALQATLAGIHKQANTSKVLVVLIGQPRGRELAWKSLHHHVLTPLKAHLATYFMPLANTTSRPLIEAMAHYTWRVPEPANGDWSQWLDRAESLCGGSAARSTWPRLCEHATEGAYWGGGFKRCPHHKSKSGSCSSTR
jgi:hypothetical protein